MLTRQEAKAFYDRFGSKQDLQRIYEDPAIRVLLERSELERASSVVELGSGTGRLAEQLLAGRLPQAARYLGLDISTTMVELARARLQRFGERARIVQSDGAPALEGVPSRSIDRFVSTYVFDLLSEEDIGRWLAEAHRVLAPDGRLCLTSLTTGRTATSRLLCRVWSAVHAASPSLVGGCRPLVLSDLIGSRWRVLTDETICTFGICTEVLVAEPAD